MVNFHNLRLAAVLFIKKAGRMKFQFMKKTKNEKKPLTSQALSAKIHNIIKSNEGN